METVEILRAVKSLSRARRSCTYYRVDLHVHSPASSDYQGEQEISHYEFVSEFADRGCDMIAITDHHTGEFIDGAIEASAQLERNEGKKIVILPGVELNVFPGVHLLAILGDGGSEGIADLLSRLKVPVGRRGDTTYIIKSQIGDIIDIVHERDGLLIGAHCNSTHGVIKELNGQPRLDWLSALDALEIKSGQVESKVSKTKSYVTNDLRVTIPFTFGSDSHDAAIENSGMWVKMANPSITSLRQLKFEPDLRVRRTVPAALIHGRVVGFTATHGIYADERFRFSPNLNVLLGGRGAGKSAAIDLLRFAYGEEPSTENDNYAVFANRIKGFLKSVGKVFVVVESADRKTYLITRSGAYSQRRPNAIPKFSDAAQVFQVVNNKLMPRNMRPQDVLGIEFYGQGEAARLADRIGEQMRLIDENIDLSEPTEIISETEWELNEEERQVLELEKRAEQLRGEAAARFELEERRDRLAETLADPIFAERNRWDSEQNWMQQRQHWVQSVLDKLPGSLPSRSDVPIDIEGSSAKDVIKKIRDATDRLRESGGADLHRLREKVAGVMSELGDYRAEWNRAFESADRSYRARLADLEAKDLEQVAAEHRNLEQELARITTMVVPEIEHIEKQISVLESRRAKHLDKLRTARARRDSLRAKFVGELNSRLGGTVEVSLSNSDTSHYFDAIDGPMQRSGIHNREEQILRICNSFAPQNFVEIIRAESIDHLTAIGITPNSAKLMTQRLSEEKLFMIERVDVPPLPCIQIKREGENSYTELSSLSVGEKCSAILSIALLNKDKPLVIDQPEDDLDHAFIIDSIVEGIRKAKSDRQIITATHNPNIPVLGDAEMIFRVARQPGNDICQIQNSGGLDLPQITEEVQRLEGGAEAFERRRQRYTGVGKS